MHRFILFAGMVRYPAGGYDDYIGSRNSIEALKKLAKSCKIGGYNELPDWADIVDVTNMQRLYSLRNSEWLVDETEPSHNCSKR